MQQPHLEIIRHDPPSGVKSRTPLVFVHGAFAGAWCWAEHFLPYFAAAGWPSIALSLRGHGASGGHETLAMTGLGDYVDDLRHVIDGLARPAVLIGHSMGGMVVQKYLGEHQAPGAVLMASVPPFGLAWTGASLMFTDPLLFQQLGLLMTLGPEWGSPDTLKRALFSDDMDRADLERYFHKSQGESHRVVMDLSGWDLPRRPPASGMPLMVMGAGRDKLVPSALVRASAYQFNRQAVIVPGMAHAMMLERKWTVAADLIRDWLIHHSL